MLNIKPSFPLRREFVKGVKEPPTKPKIWYILLTYTYLLDIWGLNSFQFLSTLQNLLGLHHLLNHYHKISSASLLYHIPVQTPTQFQTLE